MANVAGDSADATVPAVTGTNTALDPNGIGVEGESENGWGVHGRSKKGRGVVARSETDYGLRAHSDKSAGLRASSDEGRGMEGWSTKAEGVVGISETGNGMWGQTKEGTGVLGTSEKGIGLIGESRSNKGVSGRSDTDYGVRAHSRASAGLRGSSDESRGVEGWSTKSEGVVGISVTGNGVWGQTKGGTGVLGTSDDGAGVWGSSTNFEGVHAETRSKTASAMAVRQLEETSDAAALFVVHAGNRTAAFFQGNVTVTGDITLANADCAEEFDIAARSAAEPGMVMVLDREGNLQESVQPYDRRVAGVVAGAGHYKPGLVLDKQPGRNDRKPIALVGKVFCKVDARFGPIEVGDLLTTSPTAGHAMRASDPLKAFGAVIGKALRPLESGQGLIPILIALQ